MATDTSVESKIEILREYTARVCNAHEPELASEYVTPDVKWHGRGPLVALLTMAKQAISETRR
jgi:hypothetical protein